MKGLFGGPRRGDRVVRSPRSPLAVVAWMVFIASLVVVAAPQAVVAMTYNNSTGPGYTVSLCIDDPSDGATVSDDATVSASLSVTGSNPGRASS